MLSVEDPVAAFFLDKAVAAFGTRVDNEMETAAQGKSGQAAQMSQNMVLMRWLGEQESAVKFRDPAAK